MQNFCNSLFLGGECRDRENHSKVVGLDKQVQGVIVLAFCFHVIKFLHYPCHLAH